MAVQNRGNEICSFFIYDHNVLKHEEDDLKDAIIYFWPHTVSVDNQCALVGKLIGISDFFFNTLPESPPKIIKIYSEKFATRREGDFTISLGCDLDIPDAFITRHLDFVWKVFVFFQGSLNAVRQRCKSNQSFPLELAKVWDLYIPVCQFYGDLLSQAFQILPDIQLPKSSSKTFLHASHILQRSHRQPGVLGGAILYKSKVLCTQLSADVTKRFLLLKPQQTHLPCQEIKTDFELPGGMRLLRVFLSSEEYKNLGSRRTHSLKSKTHHSSSDHTQLLCYDTNTPMSSKVPSMQCDSAMSEAPQLQDIVKRILKGGEEFGEAESLDSNQNQSITEEKTKELQSLEEVPQLNLMESRETTHTTEMVETVFGNGDVMDSGTSMISQPKKGQDVDVRRVNGIRKSFSEAELEVKSEEVSTISDDGKLSSDLDHNVADSSVAMEISSTDGVKHESKETNSTEQTHEQVCESRTDESENEVKISDPELPVVKDGALNASEERIDMSDSTPNDCDANDKDVHDESLGESEQIAESVISGHTTEGETSEDSKHDVLGKDSQDNDENENMENKKEQLTLTVSLETGGANSPESVATSTSALMVTSEEYSVDDDVSVSVTDVTKSDDHVTQAGQNQSESVVESEIDAVSPLSHDDKHFVLSGGTVSSVSDDVMSSHKETLDFSADFESKSLDNSSSIRWTELTPSKEVKDRNFLPSSESYVSSSYSHSESENSGNWMAEKDGLVDLTLYVQGHSEMLLLLLLDNGMKCDKALITELWKCSLAHLAELDFEVKESLESAKTEEFGVGNYYFLQHDSYTRNVSGNVLDSVTGTAHEFITTSANMHDNFQQNETMTDILLRSHSSSVYGHQSVCHETFFQLNAPQKHAGGYPQPKDIVFTLDQMAAQKLQSDHDITLL